MISASEVWVICAGCDDRSLRGARTLAGVARSLAGEVGATAAAAVIGPRASEAAERLARRYPIVYAATAPERAAGQVPPVVAPLARLMRERRPRVVLLPDGPIERAMASRLAARLGMPSALGCSELSMDRTGSLSAIRPVYAGAAAARDLLAAETVVATLSTLGSACTEAEAAGRIEEVQLAAEPSLIALTRLWRDEPMKMAVRQADAIVAGGRGVGAEGFTLLEKLASLLGGCVAASRAAVDAGWVSKDRQIGISGERVSPRVYIACGISGASHHVAGMSGADQVVVINSDPSAPFFKLADLGLVGSVHEVLPELIDLLERTPILGAEVGP